MMYFAFLLPILMFIMLVVIGFACGHVLEQSSLAGEGIGRFCGAFVGALVAALVLYFWSVI